jgi:AbiU2
MRFDGQISSNNCGGEAKQVKLTDEKRKAVGELAQAVNNDLTEAIIYFEVSRCDAAVVERFNAARAPEGLNVITFALPLAATAALCRIWDKRGDAATIVGVANELRSEGQTDAAVELWRKRVTEIAASEDVKAALIASFRTC